MDRQADRVIATRSVSGLVANLLPPPFDMVAVSATFVRMGQRLARVYEDDITARELKPLAKAMIKGITGVALASHIGTGVFKYVPGINLWVALLIQPVALENTIRADELPVSGGSGGVGVFVDQAAQDGSSADPPGAGIGQYGAARTSIAIWDLLFDALVRPGAVVVRLILGEHGA
jgi:hypothetical protein